LTKVEEKTAYPYITEFKKEPFKSFILIETSDIGSFYLSDYDKVVDLYQFFNKNCLNDPNLTIENVYWFLLLRKYLKENVEENKKFVFGFLKKCEAEILEKDQLGFKCSPNQQKKPDIWSTYYGLSALKILGILEEYLSLNNRNDIIRKIKNFLNDHRKGNEFLHCHEKNCEHCKQDSSAKTLYYIFEIFILLGIDVRLFRKQFDNYISYLKKDLSIIFKLLCLKFIDSDSEVKDKELQTLYQYQKNDGGFSLFKQEGNISDTFWIANVLNIYSWKLDYNPASIYSFINIRIKKILENKNNWNFFSLKQVSRLIIILSLIWKKFVEEIERVIFRQLEKEKFIDVNQIKTRFGLAHGIEEIILYLNLSYTFNLRILDNFIEFNNFIQNFSQGKKILLQEIYEQIKKNSVISLSDIYKRYKSSNQYEALKLKDDIFPLIKEMGIKKFFIGDVRARRGISLKKKYFFCLEYFFENIIISDMEIDTERLYDEKEKLKEIRNDIYNMTLNLNNTTSQIKEEVESYLILDEIEYAKERLKFVLRNSLMEADFLNENIENSFNEELRYINIQATLALEIARWKKLYSILQKRLNNIEKDLKEKINEKEEAKKFGIILSDLDIKIIDIEEYINKELDAYRNYFREILEAEFSDEKFNLIKQAFNRISQYVVKYDTVIYRISQQITAKEEEIVKKHKQVINNWVKFKINFEEVTSYYNDGFQFFDNVLKEIESINYGIEKSIIEIKQKAKSRIKENNFQKAFEFIKKESDLLLNEKIKEIKELQIKVKKQISSKQKLYLLYRHLYDKLDKLEESIINSIVEQVQILKEKLVKERNRVTIDEFDNFVTNEIHNFKNQLEIYKEELGDIKNKKITDVVRGLDNIIIELDSVNKRYMKQLTNLKSSINEFDENSITVIQWEKFREFLISEISKLKDEYVNEIINHRILLMCDEGNSDKIDLKDLSDKLSLKCKALIPIIKEMLEISKLQGDLHEDDKYIIIHTKDYYKNKELKSFIENKLFKANQAKIGKILALYDSSIKNKTLFTNTLEIQNKIEDLTQFEKSLRFQFNSKVRELEIDEDRIENIQIKKEVENVIENNSSVIKGIQVNLKLFNGIQNFIGNEYNNLKFILEKEFKRVHDDTETNYSYIKLRDILDNKIQKFNGNVKEINEKVEERLKSTLNESFESRKFETEIREFYVKNKSELQKLYANKIEQIHEEISYLKDESLREKLINFINKNKINLSQLLGTLQTKIEDYIDYKEFRRAYSKVIKREREIEIEVKELNKELKNAIRNFEKQSNNFASKNNSIIIDFEKFIIGFYDILTEKVKSLEELIIKSYVEMAIKAVANQYLTLSFLQNELKIKKQRIQEHLISLISAGNLKGKYDPRIGLYYENSEILQDLDEKELEVIKKMNFRFYMFYKHLRNFTSQNYSIFAFLAAILSITISLSTATGGNPAILLILFISILILIFYFIVRRKKEKKV